MPPETALRFSFTFGVVLHFFGPRAISKCTVFCAPSSPRLQSHTRPCTCLETLRCGTLPATKPPMTTSSARPVLSWF